MKPLKHALNSVKKHGGVVEDYLPIHDFFDSSKAALPDIRHRAILHSAFGIFLLERVFGTYITNSDGRRVSVRDLGEDHVLEDLGFIPTVERWLKNLPIEEWMGGSRRKSSSKNIPLEAKKVTSEDMERIANDPKLMAEFIETGRVPGYID